MPIKNKILCYESSVNANEQMFGTATRADVWFLLEYRGHWSGSAYKDSKIPKTVKSYLNRQMKLFKNARLQVIKKQKSNDDNLKLYIAVSKEKNPKLHEITFKDYKDLLELNLKKILKSDEYLSDEKIYIICTNGAYDFCCGKIGMPVYLDIAKGKYENRTWESNHIGGHRFASTFVCLPDGVVYGRVTEGSVAEKLMKQYEKGKINLDYFRGRSSHNSEVQAAEYYLREETKNFVVSDLRHKSSKKTGDKFNIKFLNKSDKTIHTLKLRQNKNAVKVMKSCGDKTSYLSQFTLLDYKQTSSK